MPIYHNGKQYTKVFKGDHRPVNIYKGNTKIAGWHTETMSGQQLIFTETYNDKVMDLTIEGDTSGNLISRGKNLFDSNALYDIFANKLIEGGYNPTTWLSYTTLDGRRCLQNERINLTRSAVLWDKFKPNTQYIFKASIKKETTTGDGLYIGFLHTDSTRKTFIHKANEVDWVDFSIVSDAGKTVEQVYVSYGTVQTTWFDLDSMMLCELSLGEDYEPFRGYFTIPIENINDPSEIPTFYPTTIIETDSAVAPTITATVKIMD